MVLHAAPVDSHADSATSAATSDEALVALYREMTRVRALDERLVALQREGRIAFHASSLGEEAAVVGPASLLRDGDWLFPTPREMGAALLRGLPLARLLDQMFGNGRDLGKGRQSPGHAGSRGARVVAASTLTGTTLPHAVGVAWAAKVSGKEPHGAVALAHLGDGATSSGDFHNALNMAGVMKAPIVFVCRNNGFANSTPARRQTATETFAEKAVAYGIAASRVDGSDAVAVLEVAREAIARARAKQGATLVEIVTERASAGEPLKAERDPIARLRKQLEARGAWSEAAEQELATALGMELDAAIAEAESAPPPDRATMFDDVYAERPWHLREQSDAPARSR